MFKCLIIFKENNHSLALDYVNQAFKLGYEWNVDVEELRIKYVELLYLNCMDDLAHEVLPSIGSDEKLIPTLLAIVGRRLNMFLKPSDISALSPVTTDWLSGFAVDAESDFLNVESTLSKTLALLVECLHRLPNDCHDQFVANELHSLLCSMQNTSS